MRNLFYVILFALSLFLYLPGYTQEINWNALQGLGEVKYHKLDSKILDQTYHLFIRLPQPDNTDEKLPVFYLLDGGWSFSVVAGYYHYLRFSEEIPASIIVGISYGTDDWQQGNQRARDFTAKSEERAYWGGAVNFQRILQEEIFPLIEENYQADANRRVIFGNSLGGQFVLHTAITAPEIFWGYIASNPALHRNLDFYINNENLRTGSKSKVWLFVSSASEDAPRFREPALAWINHWTKQENIPWTLKTVTLDGQSHLSAVPEAFRQGIRWLFEGEVSPPSQGGD